MQCLNLYTAFKFQNTCEKTLRHELNIFICLFLDFLRWKDEFERQEKCRFVKKSGSRLREEGIRVGYYYCSRSGNYVSHSKGVKSIKKIGTSKMNNHCTASITCVELKNGKLEVKACSTHYGHEADLQHLRLTQSQKFMIAEQLCQGMPRELVLDNVRASATCDVDKLHLISLKDVKNIEKSFGIQGVSNVKTDNVYHNLIFWVSNIMKTEHCPLVYFSEDGDFESLNHKDHDLTLVLITKGQIELLNKFGTQGTFYISPFVAENVHYSFNPINPIKPYSVYITVVLLVDDIHDVVPVSYMVSHKINSNKFVNLFDSIKDKAPGISAKVILTDDREEIYDAWCAVFGDHPVHLWSNRFVDSDWRLNLIQIPDEDLQESIYEQMYSFLESSDVSKLENTLEDFVLKLQSDARTNNFGDYFASKYIGCEDLWAGCYGKAQVGVNAQLNMENVFNQIEEVVQRKNWDRNFLVRTVQHLIKYINEKQCDRHNKLQKQVQEIPTHHNLATNIKPEAVLKTKRNEWRVNSVKDPENIFSIVSRQTYSCKSDCTMFCFECDVCAHQFQCSCKVYEFDKTMCKHIHAVALKMKPCLKNKSQKATKKTKVKGKYTQELSKQVAIWEEKLSIEKKRALKHKEESKPFTSKKLNDSGRKKRKLSNLSEKEESTPDKAVRVSERVGKKRKLRNLSETTTGLGQEKSPKVEIQVVDMDEVKEEKISPDIISVESLTESSAGSLTPTCKPSSDDTEYKQETLSTETKANHSDNTSTEITEGNLSEPENKLTSQPPQTKSNDGENKSSSHFENEPSCSTIESVASETVLGTKFDNTNVRNSPENMPVSSLPEIINLPSVSDKEDSLENTPLSTTPEKLPTNIPSNKGTSSSSESLSACITENNKCANRTSEIKHEITHSDNVLPESTFTTNTANVEIATTNKCRSSSNLSDNKPESKIKKHETYRKALAKASSESKTTSNLSQNPQSTELSKSELSEKIFSLQPLNSPSQIKSVSKTSDDKNSRNPSETNSTKKISDESPVSTFKNENTATLSKSKPSGDISDGKFRRNISKNEQQNSLVKSKMCSNPSDDSCSRSKSVLNAIEAVAPKSLGSKDSGNKPTSTTSKKESLNTPSKKSKPLKEPSESSNNSEKRIVSETAKDQSGSSLRSKPARGPTEEKPAAISPKSKTLSASPKNKQAIRTSEKQPSSKASESKLFSNPLEKNSSTTSIKQSGSKLPECQPENRLANTPAKNEPGNITPSTSSAKSSLSNNFDNSKKRGRPQNVSSSSSEDSVKNKKKTP